MLGQEHTPRSKVISISWGTTLFTYKRNNPSATIQLWPDPLGLYHKTIDSTRNNISRKT